MEKPAIARPLAVLQRVEPDRERDCDAPVDHPLVIPGEVEDVAIAQLELPVHRADDPILDKYVEVVRDRDEAAPIRHEVDETAGDRRRERSLAGRPDLLLLPVADPPGRTSWSTRNRS
jgi:hypothetical protein